MSEALMDNKPHPLRIGRRTSALIAGFLAGIILSIGTDIGLHAIAYFLPWVSRCPPPGSCFWQRHIALSTA
jgi:hypothetical protein